MMVNEFKSEIKKYINTSNINYIVEQMKDRLIINMINQNVFIVKNFINEIIEKKNNNFDFIKGILKENDLEVYINLKNIESISEYESEYISVRMLNGVEVIVKDLLDGSMDIYTNNFTKIH